MGGIGRAERKIAQVPGVSGPATGVCGPVAITYGTAGSGSRLQSFVSAYPVKANLGNVLCLPASPADNFTYTLGVQQQNNYQLPSPGRLACVYNFYILPMPSVQPHALLMSLAGLRQIGYAISPAFGYSDTPAFNLAAAKVNSPVAPLPVPAGTYDASIVYQSTQSTCVSQNSTLPAAFLVQVSSATLRQPIMTLCAHHSWNTVCGPSSV